MKKKQHRNILDIYIQFRKEIKSIINSEIPVKKEFVLISKGNIIKWKNLYEYSKDLISNNYNLDEWESFLNEKFQNNPPNIEFKFLKENKEIKEHLNKKKGIALINSKFIKYFSPSNNRIKKINCHFGNGKIIIETIDKVYNKCLICQLGSKSSIKYIIYEGIKNLNKKLIEEIIKNDFEKNIDKNNFTSYGVNKIEVLDYDKNQINNRINIDNQIKQEENNCNIPNFIFEILIRLYQFTKDIRHKIETKSSETNNYYPINPNYLENIKIMYRYNEISEELANFKYINENNFEKNIPNLISLIKKKDIINEEMNFRDEKITPNIEKLSNVRHISNFSIVNNKIFNLIKKIKTYYKLKNEPSSIMFNFFYFPVFIYKSINFKCIEIGTLNKNDIFEGHYFIPMDLYNSTNILNEIRASKSLNDFFKKYNINKDKGEVQDLNNYLIKGKIINLKLLNSSNTINTVEQNFNNYEHNEIRLRSKNKNNLFNNKKTEKINFPIKNNINSFQNESIEVNEFTDPSYLDNFHIKSFKEIQYTPLIGLQNIGQTCYMNAALQCFSNTKALTNYFLNYNNLQYIKNNTITIFGTDEPSLTVEYLKLVRHLWCDPPKTYYAPYEFKKAIGKIDSLFKNFEANDAKDFVNFMVMRLHDELNGVDNNLIKHNNLAPPLIQLNSYDKSQVLQSYLYEFQINFNSFISNCFYGTTQGEFECQNCKIQLYQYGQNMPLVKYNYQTFFFLNFPLDEVRKYILSNQMLYIKYMNSNTNPNIEVNLIDCFYYYQKDDLLSCYCDRCKNINAQVLTRTKLYIAPIYLILLFNRGKGIQFKRKIDFPEILDTNGIFINPSGIYQLYGVVKHYGDNSASGHFTAYCRSPIDGMWYHYNDAMVTPVNEQEKYIIQENGMTYMLFYSQMKNI